MKTLWRILLLSLCITALVVLAEDNAEASKPKPATPTDPSPSPAPAATQPAAEKRVAVVDAIQGEDEDEDEEEEGEARSAALYAQHREDDEDEEEEEDQLALESSNIQEKDGGGHHHHHEPHHHHAPAAQAQSYAPAPPQQYHQQQQPQTIPVPLPVPVHPASVVLPTLPKQQYNPPAQYKSPPPSPYIPSHPAPQPPPPAHHQPQPYAQQPPPPPPPPQVHQQPQPAYSAQRPVYVQPPPQPRAPQTYQPQAPPPPPPPQNYAQPPPPPPYQPQPPPPAPVQAYQPPPPPPSAPAQQYNPLPEASPQQQPYPEATVQLPATAVSEPWPAPVQDMPRIVSLDVKCEKNLMKVFIEFDKPFNGVIFSKGHFANANCVHLPAGLGRQSANFDVSINTCGTTGNTENGLYGYGSQAGSGTFFENTIIVQFDPQVQEVWDQARKLRCTWHDQYEKSVTFRPFPVDMLDVVRADFAGDNVGCWMQIQVGKGPWASEVSGLVKIGQTMTMVLAIKDDDGKFDMLVRNCMAHDGKRPPIQLVDQKGCVTRPKLMSRFTKIKNFGSSASVLSYAHFQAFKFPDSMEVHFQCTIQICRNQCPDQCSEGQQQQQLPGSVSSGGSSQQYSGLEPRNPYASQRIGTAAQPRSSSADERTPRKTRRDVPEDNQLQQDVGINRIIQVVSTGDLTFALEQTKDNTTTIVFPSRSELDGLICMTSPGFAATLVVLLAILIISCLLSAFLCIRHRAFGGAVDRSLVSAFANPAFAHKKGHF